MDDKRIEFSLNAAVDTSSPRFDAFPDSHWANLLNGPPNSQSAMRDESSLYLTSADNTIDWRDDINSRAADWLYPLTGSSSFGPEEPTSLHCGSFSEQQHAGQPALSSLDPSAPIEDWSVDNILEILLDNSPSDVSIPWQGHGTDYATPRESNDYLLSGEEMPHDTAVFTDPQTTTSSSGTEFESTNANIAPETAISPNIPCFITDESRWQATLNRDSKADGHFLYCVLTTCIFCRPICPSRRPTRSNVIFVNSPADAILMGYRPCKRCRPDESCDPTRKRQLDVVERLKRALMGGIEEGASSSQSKVTVKKIAEEMGVSMWHLNRLFKQMVGCPPKTWALKQMASQSTI